MYSDGPYAVVGDNSSQYTQLSQYSQTSLELFSSQHSHNSNSQNGISMFIHILYEPVYLDALSICMYIISIITVLQLYSYAICCIVYNHLTHSIIKALSIHIFLYLANGIVDTGQCTRLMGGANHYTSTLQATTVSHLSY